MPKGIKYGGRKKGTPNKYTASVKAAFKEAFDLMQENPGVNLFEWAQANPTDFYRLCSKLIPTTTEHTGAEGKPIEIKPVTNFDSMPISDLEAIDAIITRSTKLE